MLGISHLLISGTATSLLLGTASPTMIAVGAIAGLLPDIDISTSPAGRVLPWISSFFESRIPHRSGIIQDNPTTWTREPPTFADVRKEIENRSELPTLNWSTNFSVGFCN